MIEASTPFGEGVNLFCGGEEEIVEELRDGEASCRPWLHVIACATRVRDVALMLHREAS